MDKIEFADGTQYACGFCGQPLENILFVTLDDMTYIQAAQIFAGNLDVIRFLPENGEPITFRNYTILKYLVQEQNGIRASLRKPYVGEA